jgi:hypothetical protein
MAIRALHSTSLRVKLLPLAAALSQEGAFLCGANLRRRIETNYDDRFDRLYCF